MPAFPVTIFHMLLHWLRQLNAFLGKGSGAGESTSPIHIREVEGTLHIPYCTNEGSGRGVALLYMYNKESQWWGHSTSVIQYKY